jgi:hypothetical protein
MDEPESVQNLDVMAATVCGDTRRPRPAARLSPVPRRSYSVRTAVTTVTIVSLLMATAVACSEPDTSAGAFCRALDRDMEVIGRPVSDQAGVEQLLDTYEELDRRTPLAIADSWSALTELMRTASTVVAADPDSVQLLADTAYATERSAREVATWVAQTCGFAMPAMEGIEGPVDPPPTTTPGKDLGKNSGKKNLSPTTTAG